MSFKTKQLKLKPSYLWIPEHFAYVFYEKELLPVCKAIEFLLTYKGKREASGFELNGKIFTRWFDNYPAALIIPEAYVRMDWSLKAQIPDFLKALDTNKAILNKHAKIHFILKKLFITLKQDNPATYFHYIPEQYRGKLLRRVPSLNSSEPASEHDAGYGYFPDYTFSSEQRDRIHKVKKEFQHLYDTLAAEELLKKVFSE